MKRRLPNLLILLAISLFTISSSVIAQDIFYLSNPSFESKIPSKNHMPQGWYSYGYKDESPPDIHGSDTNLWAVNEIPSHGETFVGLVTRSNGSWERIGQQLQYPLSPHKAYYFSIDLNCSPLYLSNSRTSMKVENFVAPTVLRIQGSNTKTNENGILAISTIIDHQEWKTHYFILLPEKDYDVFVLEAFYGAFYPDKEFNIETSFSQIQFVLFDA